MIKIIIKFIYFHLSCPWEWNRVLKLNFSGFWTAYRLSYFFHLSTNGGGIFILPIEECVRIRTGETGSVTIG